MDAPSPSRRTCSRAILRRIPFCGRAQALRQMRQGPSLPRRKRKSTIVSFRLPCPQVTFRVRKKVRPVFAHALPGFRLKVARFHALHPRLRALLLLHRRQPSCFHKSHDITSHAAVSIFPYQWRSCFLLFRIRQCSACFNIISPITGRRI